jgi:hypothetical protein
MVSLNIFTPSRNAGVLSRGPDEAAQKFTSATGARIPIVNRNACLTFWKQVSLPGQRLYFTR